VRESTKIHNIHHRHHQSVGSVSSLSKLAGRKPPKKELGELINNTFTEFHAYHVPNNLLNEFSKRLEDKKQSFR